MDRGTSRLARRNLQPGLLISCYWIQTLGGGSGGAEPKSLGELLPEISSADCEETARTSSPVRAGMLRGVGAHTVAKAQLGEDIGSPAERLCDGMVPCSGIWQSCWAGSRTAPRQATAPSTGWS
jgi:hypothetical protein